MMGSIQGVERLGHGFRGMHFAQGFQAYDATLRLLEVARALRPRLVAGWNYVCEGGAWVARFGGALARAAG